MPALSEDRLCLEIRERTADLADLVRGGLDRPVPTCPGWTFKQLGTHVGRGHRWAAEIVTTRSVQFIPLREVPDGKPPASPAGHAEWLNASASLVAEAAKAAGPEPVWTFIGMRPAAFWSRRRAHEAAVHLADAQLATGHEISMAADLAADGIGEWLEILAAGEGASDLAVAQSGGLRGDGQTLHFHATDEAGEWMVRRGPSGITVEPGHAKADVAVRGPAARLLLVLMRRLPPNDPAIEIFGAQALFAHWIDNTQF
ncbi:MAG TPA: maleylpyruvate isomerase family mycothiol-dependent enzyme [Streptosporangiaceae bacterium]